MQRITFANRHLLTAMLALNNRLADIASDGLFVQVGGFQLQSSLAKVDRYDWSGYSSRHWRPLCGEQLRRVISFRGSSG